MESRDMSRPQTSSEEGLALPPHLLKYLDRTGRVVSWPAKKATRLHLLEYLSSLFEMEKIYSEKEVNRLLEQYLASNDYATVRRDLCDFRYLQRERDGSRYWRVERS